MRTKGRELEITRIEKNPQRLCPYGLEPIAATRLRIQGLATNSLEIARILEDRCNT